jgi:hypothetical protein
MASVALYLIPGDPLTLVLEEIARLYPEEILVRDARSFSPRPMWLIGVPMIVSLQSKTAPVLQGRKCFDYLLPLWPTAAAPQLHRVEPADFSAEGARHEYLAETEPEDDRYDPAPEEPIGKFRTLEEVMRAREASDPPEPQAPRKAEKGSRGGPPPP